MTLAPQSRVLLTDALRPPAGHRVEVAVGTTYSLDLTALLLAPLSFALVDHARAGDATSSPDQSIDPVRLLEAVRRHSEHTTVFCQAGAIHVPRDYRSILTFVEDSVIQATPPHRPGDQEGIFHPKVWALRFRSETGECIHRVIVLSRNLTLDRSWDTILVLDEDPAGTIPAAPAARFVRALPDLGLGGGTGPGPERRSQILGLADSLESVRLSAPAPFDGGSLVPLGLSPIDEGVPGRPEGVLQAILSPPEHTHRLLAISPFLSPGLLERLGSTSTDRTLISRPDALDQMGQRVLSGWSTRVLQPQAKAVEDHGDTHPADNGSARAGGRGGSAGATEFQTGDGLHAKTVVFDLAHGRSRTVTGSANLTHAAWTRNVEFDAVLTGPTAQCGVSSCLEAQDGTPGLRELTEGYATTNAEPIAESALATSLAIEHFHRVLAQSRPQLAVSSLTAATEPEAMAPETATPDPGTEQTEVPAPGTPVVSTPHLTLTLTFRDDTWTREVPAVETGWTTTVWPVSLPTGAGRELDAGTSSDDPPMWKIGSPSSITPFLAVETRGGSGDAAAVERCVITAELVGDIEGRREAALRSILTSAADVLRYLVFLLGDAAGDSTPAGMLGAPTEPGWQGEPGRAPWDVSLLEPLVRAAGRDEETLGRVAALIEELSAMPGGQDLIPADFDALWDVVWQAHRSLREEAAHDGSDTTRS